VELPSSVELEFRDGKRVVPEYLLAVLKGLEAYRLTYDEALAQANAQIERDYLNRQQDRVLAEHFRVRR
jgi:hypothetical protein